MQVVAIYHTPEGGSRLADVDLPLAHLASDGSGWVGSKGAVSWGVAHGDKGNTKDWHRGRKASLSVVVEGAWEIEAGDGERRLLELGSILLVLDTEGQGHRSRVVGPSVKTLGVGLSDEARDEVWALLPLHQPAA